MTFKKDSQLLQAQINALLTANSGTNTGDETATTIKSKLGVSALSGSNTGDQTIPSTLPASDVYPWAKAAVKPTYTYAEVGAQVAGSYITGTGSVSGTNTGDETAATIKTKLGVTNLTGSNTGDQVIPTTLPASDVYAWAKASVKPTYVAADISNFNAAVLAVIPSEMPQVIQSVNYTCVAGDTGKHILHPSSDVTARTFTIPTNASVPYTLGTVLTFVNHNGAGVVTIACGDTMRLAGVGTAGSRTLAANGVATALKLTSTEWIISGTGLT